MLAVDNRPETPWSEIEAKLCKSCDGFGFYVLEGDEENEIKCRACEGSGMKQST